MVSDRCLDSSTRRFRCQHIRQYRRHFRYWYRNRNNSNIYIYIIKYVCFFCCFSKTVQDSPGSKRTLCCWPACKTNASQYIVTLATGKLLCKSLNVYLRGSKACFSFTQYSALNLTGFQSSDLSKYKHSTLKALEKKITEIID